MRPSHLLEREWRSVIKLTVQSSCLSCHALDHHSYCPGRDDRRGKFGELNSHSRRKAVRIEEDVRN